MKWLNNLLTVSTLFSVFAAVLIDAATAAEPVSRDGPFVEIEEEVYAFEPANNGAGPMWCFGNTCIVRDGDRVFASGLHTIEMAKPLNNCVPSLFIRDERGWKRVYQSKRRTREPSPLGVIPGESILLSVNPTQTPPDTYSGPSLPEILQFGADSLSDQPERFVPTWDGEPRFTEHSYRSFAVDGKNREMILLQNVDYTHAEWTFRDRDAKWSAGGKLHWPRDAAGKPLRICYPTVALDDRRVFVFGVTDIVEPNREWLEYKRDLTGREWDYVFRQLYYTWSDDITTGEFHDWIEVSNCQSTAGSLFPNDLFVHPSGDVSLLWSETALDVRLQNHFFPEARQRHALEYANVRKGKIAYRTSVLESREGNSRLLPGRGRFHVTPDGRLWVFCYVQGVDGAGKSISRNQLVEVGPEGALSTPSVVNLRFPLASFFTNTVRAGCLPSESLDIFGQTGNRMHYARIRLH